MRLYLEPSILVKLFKAETDTDQVIQLVSLVDKNPKWYCTSSTWSLLGGQGPEKGP